MSGADQGTALAGSPRAVAKKVVGFRGALQMLNDKAIRHRPLKERRELMDAIVAGIEAAIADAHMSGRVYHKGGEVRTPGCEHLVMLEHALAAGRREYSRVLVGDAEGSR